MKQIKEALAKTTPVNEEGFYPDSLKTEIEEYNHNLADLRGRSGAYDGEMDSLFISALDGNPNALKEAQMLKATAFTLAQSALALVRGKKGFDAKVLNARTERGKVAKLELEEAIKTFRINASGILPESEVDAAEANSTELNKMKRDAIKAYASLSTKKVWSETDSDAVAMLENIVKRALA